MSLLLDATGLSQRTALGVGAACATAPGVRNISLLGFVLVACGAPPPPSVGLAPSDSAADYKALVTRSPCSQTFVPKLASPAPAAPDNNVFWSGLYSDSSALFVSPVSPTASDPVTVRVRARAGDLTAGFVTMQDTTTTSVLPLSKQATLDPTARFEYWAATIPASASTKRYRFQLVDGTASAWLNACGPSATEVVSQDFWIVPGFAPPDWSKQSVFYQIFVDRFFDGDTSNNPVDGTALLGGTQHVKMHASWNDAPVNSYDFFGGDLAGVTAKLSYLQDLGVDALYLNPIFSAPTNHKYDTADYLHVDAAYGGDGALTQLVGALHSAAMKIVVDGVFNHVGYGHFWFDKYAQFQTLGADKGGQQQQQSQWLDRFTFNSGACGYAHFLGSCPLVKLDYNSASLKSDIFGDGGVLDTWLTAFAVDGVRMDAAQMIGTGGVDARNNAALLGQFRQALKTDNPNALLIAETDWGAHQTQWLLGDQMDGVMNYQGFATPVSRFVNGKDIGNNASSLSVSAFDLAIRSALAEAPVAANLRKWNSLTTHDIQRFLTRAGGDTAKMGEALFLQMGLPGTPVIYYGDEIGTLGGADPQNRKTFDWNSTNWKTDIQSLTRALVAARHQFSALQDGGMMTLLAAGNTYAFARTNNDDAGQVVVVVNNGAAADVTIPVWYASIPDGATLTDYVSLRTFTVAEGEVTIPAMAANAGMLLTR